MTVPQLSLEIFSAVRAIRYRPRIFAEMLARSHYQNREFLLFPYSALGQAVNGPSHNPKNVVMRAVLRR